MSYKLGTGVQLGDKILLGTGWKKILKITEKGVEVEGGFIEYKQNILGWKRTNN